VSIGNIKEEHHSNGVISGRWHYDTDGHLHREDGPAVEWFRKDGALWHRTWHRHGKYHREGNPAYEAYHTNGTLAYRAWYSQGDLHREDGPAEEWLHGDGTAKKATYRLDGNRVLEEEHRRRVALRKLTAAAAGKLEVSL